MAEESPRGSYAIKYVCMYVCMYFSIGFRFLPFIPVSLGYPVSDASPPKIYIYV